MKKIDLVESLSKESEITRAEVKKSVEVILDLMFEAIVSGKGIEFRGFGGFKKRHRKRRMGVNPKTSEKTMVSEKFVPFFKPGKFLKEAVNKG